MRSRSTLTALAIATASAMLLTTPLATAQQRHDGENCAMLATYTDTRALIYNDCHYWIRASVSVRGAEDPDCVWVPPQGQNDVLVSGPPEYAYDCTDV